MAHLSSTAALLVIPAAAASLSALSFKSPFRLWPWWLASGAAFLTGWLTGNAMAALASTFLSTAIIIAATAMGMASASVAIRAGSSDLLLVAGFTAHHSESGLWTIDQGLTAGGSAVAASVVLRAAILSGDTSGRSAPMTLLALWQAVWIAAEFGSLPGHYLVVGAVAVIAAGLVASRAEKSAVWIALGAGIGFVLQGLGSSPWLVIAAILAGVAAFLGQAAAGLAAVLVALAFAPAPGLSPESLFAAVVLGGLVIAAVGRGDVAPRRGGSQGLFIALLALLLALVGAKSSLAWVSVLGGAVFAGVWTVLMPADAREADEWVGSADGTRPAPVWAAPLAAGLLLLAGVAWLRLLLEGLRTQFL